MKKVRDVLVDAQRPEAQRPILDLTHIGDDGSERRLAKVLARIIVRHTLEEETLKRPTDPALKLEASRTEIPRINEKRLSKLEVMTAGELVRLLGIPVAQLFNHVELGTIPHRRIGGQLLFSRRGACLDW